ncbi:MAG: tail fiber domain-containing protein [Richelia sp. SM1_7_0]|nr:tail fiber domain-containing protein [Richelia sp. SM1_7_0]
MIKLVAEGVVFEIKNATHGGNDSNKQILWNGDGNWDELSDLRLKTDIENEGNILSRLMQLEVKNYRWKDDPDAPTKKIGFIAQDVQPLFPYLVGEMKYQDNDEDNDEKTLTLKYGVFSVLAVGALRELKQEKDAEINALKIQIQELKNLMLMK